MFRNSLRLVAALFLLLTLAACNNDESASQTPAEAPAIDNSDPAQAVIAQAKLLKLGKFDALVRASLPPEDYQKFRHNFRDLGKDADQITAEERKKFAANMRKLTAPDAEKQLYQRLSPVLDQYQTKYKALLPMYIGMAQTVATTAIQQSAELSAAQKDQISTLMRGAARWVQSTDWGNRDKAKKAIATLVATARDVDIKTIEQARALDYEQAMHKYSRIWDGARQLLAVYGLDVNQALASVKATTVQREDHKAVVEVGFKLFGEPQKTRVKMLERDGHWYVAERLEQLQEALTQPAPGQSAATQAAPAQAATVAATTATAAST